MNDFSKRVPKFLFAYIQGVVNIEKRIKIVLIEFLSIHSSLALELLWIFL